MTSPNPPYISPDGPVPDPSIDPGPTTPRIDPDVNEPPHTDPETDPPRVDPIPVDPPQGDPAPDPMRNPGIDPPGPAILD